MTAKGMVCMSGFEISGGSLPASALEMLKMPESKVRFIGRGGLAMLLKPVLLFMVLDDDSNTWIYEDGSEVASQRREQVDALTAEIIELKRVNDTRTEELCNINAALVAENARLVAENEELGGTDVVVLKERAAELSQRVQELESINVGLMSKIARLEKNIAQLTRQIGTSASASIRAGGEYGQKMFGYTPKQDAD